MSPRRISRDLKLHAHLLVTTGLYSASSATTILGVSERSIRRWVASSRHCGDVETHSLFCGRNSTLSHATLRELYDLVISSPTLYLDEICTWFTAHRGLRLSISAIHRGLERLGLTRKKLRRTAAQRDELTRAQWKANITSWFTATQLVFADESSKDNRTLLSVDGILTVRVVRGSVDGLEFYDWVVSDLLPKMNPYPGPNSVLIVDNCTTHKNEAVVSISFSRHTRPI
ncbi:hypothetical protein V8D89_004966 [Ganoderma adspersum]